MFIFTFLIFFILPFYETYKVPQEFNNYLTWKLCYLDSSHTMEEINFKDSYRTNLNNSHQSNVYLGRAVSELK